MSSPSPVHPIRQLAVSINKERAYQPTLYIDTVQGGNKDMQGWRFAIVNYFDTITKQLSKHYDKDLPPDLLPFAMSYLDRYCGKKAVSAVLFQLSALTSLLVSSKIWGFGCIKVSLLVKLSRKRFMPQDFHLMEKDLLIQLGFLLHPPTAIRVVTDLKAFAPKELFTPEVEAGIVRDLDRAMGDYELLAMPPSALALTVLRRALGSEETDGKGWWPAALHALAPSDAALASCAERLAELQQKDEEIAVATPTQADPQDTATDSEVAAIGSGGAVEDRVKANSPDSVMEGPSFIAAHSNPTTHRPAPLRKRKHPSDEAQAGDTPVSNRRRLVIGRVSTTHA